MCIRKKFLPNKGVCQVTFVLPNSVASNSKKVALVGDFNGWNSEINPMKKTKDGKFLCVLKLPMWKKYQFRYLLDNTHWENDWDGDGLTATPYKNCFNSLLKL